MKKKKIALVFIPFFILLFVFLKFKHEGIKHTFIYPSANYSGLYRKEYRYLPVNPVQGNIENYIDELLLGPLSVKLKPLFASGTKVISCFKRGNILYVNLSEDILNENPETYNFKENIRIFEKNIKLNFHDIKEIELFINGNTSFENYDE